MIVADLEKKMKIELFKLTNSKPFDFVYYFTNKDKITLAEDYNGFFANEGLHVQGTIYRLSAGEFQINFTVSGEIFFPCARCLKAVNVESFYEYSDVVQTKNLDIEINTWVEECLFINEPFRVLCKENCKGLCPKCGINLNKATCNCKLDSEIDPRLDALKKLL